MTSLAALSRRFGVTRLARLTGLDRLGVEVVGAVRPRGHVLQVSQGKGRTLSHAQWSALGEAIELAAAETPDPRRLRFGAAPGPTTWDVGELNVAWVDGVDLGTRRKVWVPAEAVYCPPAGVAWLGPSVTVWRSNGLGAHPTSKAAAVEHALLELIERDALARTLPEGWTAAAVKKRFVRRLEVPAGFAAFSFDLTPRGGGVPLAGALLFDLEESAVPLTAGYAARRTWAAAEESAFLEAAQSRLTEIHGAREDVAIGAREAGREVLALVQRLRSRAAPELRVTGSLARRLPFDVTLVTLRERPWVVKAVSPDALVSELL